MKRLALFFLSLCFSSVFGQNCSAKFNTALTGQCEFADQCQGTVLSRGSCEFGSCCVSPTTNLPGTSCLDKNLFQSLFNSSRSVYLSNILSYGMNRAGICVNCQAKAAFLAVAATMTENFQKDEVIGSDFSFLADDSKYGNNQLGDGSRFRRRGFFGLRGKTMYQRLQDVLPQFQVINNPELAAIVENSIEIAAKLWNDPTLQRETSLTNFADGTFHGFSMLWYKLTGGIEELAEAAKSYSMFLRALQCGGDLYPGQGGICQYNATHQGSCIPDCIRGLEDAGEFCGCSGEKGAQCPGSAPHIRCCLSSCSQELKMDFGLVLDSSGSVLASGFELQRKFVIDLLSRINVGPNKTHVGIINYSDQVLTVTNLNTDYELDQKTRRMQSTPFIGRGTNTAAALRGANVMFSQGNGLRPTEEGATQVIFVITDGVSDDRRATLQAADVLKQNGIHLVSVGVGNQLDIFELHSICTPPASENYFAITDYDSLEKKLSQFTSKTCSEPAVVPANSTVTTECGRDKYKFLKLKIIVTGNKIMIKIKLFNGKVKLFYSFKTRNPKDPADFVDYSKTRHNSLRTFWNGVKDRIQPKANNDLVTLVVDKPDDDQIDFVYVGIKGVEEENKFEVNLEDCALVDCRSMGSTISTMKFSLIFLVFLSMKFSFL